MPAGYEAKGIAGLEAGLTAASGGGAEAPFARVIVDGKPYVVSTQEARALLQDVVPVCKCFPAGTKIATPHGTVPIEKLHVGDRVLAENPKSGKVEAEPVQAVIVRPVSPLLALELSDGSTLTVQPEHYFWLDGGVGLHGAGWLQARQMRRGDRLRTVSGHDVTVVGIRWHVGHAVVYTLTVAKDHTFFVGSARVLVHNGSIQCSLSDYAPYQGNAFTGIVFGRGIKGADGLQLMYQFADIGERAAQEATDFYGSFASAFLGQFGSAYRWTEADIRKYLTSKMTFAVNGSRNAVAINYMTLENVAGLSNAAKNALREDIYTALEKAAGSDWTIIKADPGEHAEMAMYRYISEMTSVAPSVRSAKVIGISNYNGVCSGQCKPFFGGNTSVAKPVVIYYYGKRT